MSFGWELNHSWTLLSQNWLGLDILCTHATIFLIKPQTGKKKSATKWKVLSYIIHICNARPVVQKIDDTPLQPVDWRVRKRVKPMKECESQIYREGEQKAQRTDEKLQTTMRTGFSASEDRQYFKTEGGETVGVNSCMTVCVWVLCFDLPKHTVVRWHHGA